MLTHKKIERLLNAHNQNKLIITQNLVDEMVTLLDEAHDQLIEQRAKLREIGNLSFVFAYEEVEGVEE